MHNKIQEQKRLKFGVWEVTRLNRAFISLSPVVFGASGSLHSTQGFVHGRTMLLDLQRTVIETLQIAEHGTCSSNALFYSGNALSYPELF